MLQLGEIDKPSSVHASLSWTASKNTFLESLFPGKLTWFSSSGEKLTWFSSSGIMDDFLNTKLQNQRFSFWTPFTFFLPVQGQFILICDKAPTNFPFLCRGVKGPRLKQNLNLVSNKETGNCRKKFNFHFFWALGDVWYFLASFGTGVGPSIYADGVNGKMAESLRSKEPSS